MTILRNVFCLLVFLACFCSVGNAQGTILFNNYVPGVVDARAIGLGSGPGHLLGKEWRAQLVLYDRNNSLTPYTPLTPTTLFTDSPYWTGGSGCVAPIVVTVPNSKPGDEISVYMAAFPERYSDINAAASDPWFIGVGRTDVVKVRLGGDGTPPGMLQGLVSFSFGYFSIPEPSSFALLLFGALGLFLVKRFRNT